ncbi:L-lactate permease [Chloroflexota bacterium]
MHALTAVVPILLVLILMVVFNRTAKIAMTIGWIIVCILAYFVWKMPPYWIAGASITGVLIATNILVIILGAIALFYSMRESGALSRISDAIINLNPDRRVQVSLAWFIAAFVEGIAGFGTPGALVGPLLVSIGFPARIAVPLILILNSTPVSFGVIGIPTVAGIGYTLDIPSVNAALSGAGIDYWHWLNHMVTTSVASIHGIIGIFVPVMAVTFVVKWSGGKLRDITEAIPSALLGGLLFVIPFFLVAYFTGPELASVLGALIGMAIYTLLLKKGLFNFPKRYTFPDKMSGGITVPEKPQVSYGIFRSFLPYILISLILILTKVVPQLNIFCSSNGILAFDNILGTSASFTFKFLQNPGIYFLIIVLLSHLIFNMNRVQITATWRKTIKSLAPAAIALWFAIALSQVMILSGNNLSQMDSMVSVIARAAAAGTGQIYPLISPFIGILGSYMAGSNTVSNIMMVGFQYETAALLNIPRTIIVALQDIGGAVGNMICVHNVVAVCATVGIIGQEGSVIRRNLLPCLTYGLAAGIIGFLAIHILPGLF